MEQILAEPPLADLARQIAQRFASPADLDYAVIGGLSNEGRDKLKRARPATLGAAARISGVTPAALTALLGHVRRSGERQKRRA